MAELKNNIADWKTSVSITQDKLLGLHAKKVSRVLCDESPDLGRWTATANYLLAKDNSQVYSVIQRVL